MKKAFYILFAFVAAAAVVVSGCSKKDGGSGAIAYAPTACYANGINPQLGYGYQFINGQCIDTRTNTPAPIDACNNIYYGNPQCNAYGNQFFYQGTINDAAWRCSLLNVPGKTYYPVMFPHGYMCVSYYTYNLFMGYGMPAYYPNFTGVYQGCLVGPSNPRCRGFGGTLGFYGGIELGIYY